MSLKRFVMFTMGIILIGLLSQFPQYVQAQYNEEAAPRTAVEFADKLSGFTPISIGSISELPAGTLLNFGSEDPNDVPNICNVFPKLGKECESWEWSAESSKVGRSRLDNILARGLGHAYILPNGQIVYTLEVPNTAIPTKEILKYEHDCFYFGHDCSAPAPSAPEAQVAIQTQPTVAPTALPTDIIPTEVTATDLPTETATDVVPTEPTQPPPVPTEPSQTPVTPTEATPTEVTPTEVTVVPTPRPMWIEVYNEGSNEIATATETWIRFHLPVHPVEGGCQFTIDPEWQGRGNIAPEDGGWVWSFIHHDAYKLVAPSKGQTIWIKCGEDMVDFVNPVEPLG